MSRSTIDFGDDADDNDDDELRSETVSTRALPSLLNFETLCFPLLHYSTSKLRSARVKKRRSRCHSSDFRCSTGTTVYNHPPFFHFLYVFFFELKSVACLTPG